MNTPVGPPPALTAPIEFVHELAFGDRQEIWRPALRTEFFVKPITPGFEDDGLLRHVCEVVTGLSGGDIGFTLKRDANFGPIITVALAPTHDPNFAATCSADQTGGLIRSAQVLLSPVWWNSRPDLREKFLGHELAHALGIVHVSEKWNVHGAFLQGGAQRCEFHPWEAETWKWLASMLPGARRSSSLMGLLSLPFTTRANPDCPLDLMLGEDWGE
jgi:hypothetical protein